MPPPGCEDFCAKCGSFEPLNSCRTPSQAWTIFIPEQGDPTGAWVLHGSLYDCDKQKILQFPEHHTRMHIPDFCQFARNFEVHVFGKVTHIEYIFLVPESACEGFFVKNNHYNTSSRPHICWSISSRLHICWSTSSHPHICSCTSSHPHICWSTSSYLHICWSTSHTLTSADLHLHTLSPADLHLHPFTSADYGKRVKRLEVCR